MDFTAIVKVKDFLPLYLQAILCIHEEENGLYGLALFNAIIIGWLHLQKPI